MSQDCEEGCGLGMVTTQTSRKRASGSWPPVMQNAPKKPETEEGSGGDGCSCGCCGCLIILIFVCIILPITIYLWRVAIGA